MNGLSNWIWMYYGQRDVGSGTKEYTHLNSFQWVELEFKSFGISKNQTRPDGNRDGCPDRVRLNRGPGILQDEKRDLLRMDRIDWKLNI